MPVVFVGVGAALGIVVLFLLYLSWQKQLNDENTRIKQLQAQKADLEQIKASRWDTFEAQKEDFDAARANHLNNYSAIAPAARNCWTK